VTKNSNFENTYTIHITVIKTKRKMNQNNGISSQSLNKITIYISKIINKKKKKKKKNNLK
jgi:hypothetical protein